MENKIKQSSGPLKRLLLFTLDYPKLLVPALLLLAVSTVADVIGPMLIKIFIDDYLTPNQLEVVPLTLMSLLYFSLAIISALAFYYQSLKFSEISLQVVQKIREQVFGKVIRLPLSFFDHTPTGSLVSRISNDTEAIKDLYVNVLSSIIQNMVYICSIFVAMAILDWKLMLICLIFLPIVICLMLLYQRLSTPLFHRSRSLLSDINANLNESIQGMKIIQFLNQQKRFNQRFQKTVEQHYWARLANMKLDGLLLRPFIDFLHILTLAGVLYFFGQASLVQTVEIGVIYAFINYLSRFVQPMIEMTQRLNLLQKALVSGERIFELLDKPTEAVNDEAPHVINRGEIEFRDVSFSYDQKMQVLSNIRLHTKPGEFIGVVGHTGSGKSTLMSLLLRFYPLSQGDILIDGIPLTEYSSKKLRQSLGIVQQDPFIFSGTFAENISMGENFSPMQVEAAAKAAQLHEFIQSQSDGYGTILAEGGSNLSTGQRQLLSLARTLVRKPKILILDEATANIDSYTEAKIQESLMALRGKVTLLAIAHRLSTIRGADRIIVLHRGKIVQEGNHEALMQVDGLYKHLYQLQEQSDPYKEKEFA